MGRTPTHERYSHFGSYSGSVLSRPVLSLTERKHGQRAGAVVKRAQALAIVGNPPALNIWSAQDDHVCARGEQVPSISGRVSDYSLGEITIATALKMVSE
jgi:hypothetical protein